MAFLLVFGAVLSAHAGPPSSTLPGRKPGSTEPWGAFLGRAAHEAIGRQYQAEHPSHRVFLNTISLSVIVERAAQKQKPLSRQEAEPYDEMAEQALRAAYKAGEWPSSSQGQVFLPVDCL